MMSGGSDPQYILELLKVPCTVALLCLCFWAGVRFLLVHDVGRKPGSHTSDENHGVSDKTLLDISQSIPNDMHINTLGVELGIDWDEIVRYVKTNTMGGEVTSRGTLNMISTWRQKTKPKLQTALLRNALEKAGLLAIAENFLPLSSASPPPPLLPSSPPPSPSKYSEIGSVDEEGMKTSLPDENAIERCRLDIMTYFRTYLCRIKTDPLNFNTYVDFDQIYTNLCLLEENGLKKVPLEYQDILSLKINGEPVKRLLIQGEAGAGKTTLCAKIAWDWVSGVGFQNYKLVLVVQLRHYKTSITVGQMIEKYLKDDNPATAEQIDNYCIANPDKLLLLLDGLDEFSGDLSDESREDIIVKIIRSSKFCSTTAIVTTRPWKAGEVRGNLDIRQPFRFVEVQGFKPKDVATYVGKFFSFSADDAPLADDLVSFVDENEIISQDMAPFPIYVSMLCVMWRELPQERLDGIRKMQTFSQIFDTMISFLIDHFRAKGIKQGTDIDQSTIELVKECQKQIGELALNGLVNKKLAFSCDDFKEFENARVIGCQLGILSQEEEIVPERYRRRGMKELLLTSITFPHKLFQEFMAGLYLSVLFETDRDAFVNYIQESVIPRAHEFRYLLYFLTAQKEDIGVDVLKRLCENLKDGDDKRDLIADVVFECHSEEAARLVEEFLHLNYKGERLTVRYLKPHTLSGYLYSLKHLVNLSIYRNSYGINGSRVLADGVCSIATLEDLVLRESVLHAEFYQRVATDAKSSKIRELKWEEQDLTDDAVASEHAADWISSMQSLTSLILMNTAFHDGFYQRIAENSFLSRICHLQLHNLHLTEDKPSRDIAEWISLMPLLTRLEMNEIDFHNEFYIQASLKAKSSKLNTLTIRKAQLSDATTSCSAAKWICALENLTNLNLAGLGELNESFFSHMVTAAASLKVNTFWLEKIILPEEIISRSLATLIYSLPCLTHLVIEQSRFHEVFFDDLAMHACAMKMDTLELKRMPHPYRKKTARHVSQRAAEWISSMSSLRSMLLFLPSFHESFTACLSSRAKQSKIRVLKLLRESNVPTSRFSGKSAISRDAATWICSLPELQRLELVGEFPKEFIARVSCHVQEGSNISTLILTNNHPEGEESADPDDEARWINSMQSLSHLQISGQPEKEFYAMVQRDASSSHITSLEMSNIHIRGDKYAKTSRDAARWISSLQCLSELKLEGNFHDDFFGELARSASSSKIVQLRLDHNLVPSFPSNDKEPTSNDAAEWIRSLPHLTDLSISGTFAADFYSELARNAGSLKIVILNVSLTVDCIASAPDVLQLIVSLPCLRNLTLEEKWSEEFYSEIATTSPNLKIEKLQFSRNSLRYNEFASKELRNWISSMSPGISELVLRDQLHDGFYQVLSKSTAVQALKEITINAEQLSRLFVHGMANFFLGIPKLSIEFESSVEIELFHVVTLPKLRTLVLGSRRGSNPNLDNPAELCSCLIKYMPRLSSVSFDNLKIGNTNATLILRELDAHHTFLQNVKFVDCNTTSSLDIRAPTDDNEWNFDLTAEHGPAVKKW